MKRICYVLKASFLAVALCILLTGMASAHTIAPQQSQGVAHTLRAHDTSVYIWATSVNVHTCASTTCELVGQISTTTVTDVCQAQGETVTAEGYTNNWWSQIVGPGGIRGWVSNIYIRGDAYIAGVPTC